MIVKNEAHVITRCLDLVRPLISHVCIQDNGSTDGTPEMITRWLQQHGVPGSVYHHPWVDFGHNRTHALQTLRSVREVDFALVMDADDELVIEAGARDELEQFCSSADAFLVRLQHGDVQFERIQLVRNAAPNEYRGVLHEYLQTPPDTRLHRLSNVWIRSNREGGRSLDPFKYQNDARVLEQALKTEQDPHLRARYTFYLAQSYRDAGLYPQAVECYTHRSGLGFWEQEVYVALVEAAQISVTHLKSYNPDHVMAMLIQAINLIPTRVEAAYWLSRLLAKHNHPARAYRVAQAAHHLKPLAENLFQQNWIYNHGLSDWLSELAARLNQTTDPARDVSG